MMYYVIEHPTRGCLVEYDLVECKPRFSWSVLRTDPSIMAFYNKHTLKAMLNRLTPSVRDKCVVLTIENGRVKQQ